MDRVKLCDKCAPLLERPELDTIGRLRAKLCMQCRARLTLTRAKARATEPTTARVRIGVLHVEGDGDTVISALQRFTAAGANAQRAVDEITKPRPPRRR